MSSSTEIYEVRWAEHVARMRETRDAYENVRGKTSWETAT
jgi:hypothetical protein